jgi:hypothetical protein
MRTLVWGWDLTSGSRERGKAAVCEGDGTDERGPLVSVRVRGGGSARGSRGRALLGRLGPDPSGPPAWHSALFFFLFV